MNADKKGPPRRLNRNSQFWSAVRSRRRRGDGGIYTGSRLLTMLRTSLILALCYCASTLLATVNEDAVAAWIQDTGGALQKNRAGQIVEVDLTSTWITDDDLAKIATLTELRKLNLS